MNKEMLLVVPSRGRPQNIKRLDEALFTTDSDLDFICAVDEDDPRLEDYLDLPINAEIVVGPRLKFAGTVNSVVMNHIKEYKYFAWMGDDHLPKTWQWDRFYRDALDEIGTGVVYGNDLVMGEAIATELAFTADIPRALGYAIPPGFVHLYVDNYFMELGKSVDKLRYLPNVIVQHLHPSAGTANEDLTYKEANSPENWTNDRIRFETYLKEELPIDSKRLRRLL